jgi:hypothetical protein
VGKCIDCKHNNNGFCFTAQSCYKYSQFKPIIKSDTKQLDQQTFTKDDLKVGMVVELRNGEKFLGIKVGLAGVNDDCLYEYDRYASDLKYYSTSMYDVPSFDIVKVYTTNNLIEVLEGNYDSLELVWERDAFDWSQVAVDTKVIITTESGKTFNRYFAKYEDGKVFVFNGGRTSFTNENYALAWWNKVKLYKEGETE